MLKKLTSLILSLLLVMSSFSNVFASTLVLTVAVDQPTYISGSEVNISGTILEDGQAAKGYNPTLVVEDPNGNREFFSQFNNDEILADGRFATFFTLGDDASTGVYKVTVSAATQTAVANFEVIPATNNENQVQATVITNKSQYTTNESVLLSGTVTDNGRAASGAVVTVLFSIDGNVEKTDQVYTNGRGEYRSSLTLQNSSKPGIYQVVVKVLNKEFVGNFTVVPVVITPPGNGGGGPTPPPPTPEPPTPPIPEPPKPPTPPSNDGLPGTVDNSAGADTTKLVVDNKQLDSLVQDNEKKDVTIDFSKVADDKLKNVQAELGADSIKKVADANKTFVFKTKTEAVSVPTEVLADIVKTSATKVTFVVEKKASQDLEGAKGKNVVTDILDLSILLEKDGTKTKFTNFRENVQVDVSLKGKAFTDKRKMAAYYINEQTGQLEYVGGKLNGETFSFTTNHFSMYAIIENNKTFKDVASLWAKEEIEVLASREIIKGQTEELFAPNKDVTRAQFALLLVRALNLPKSAYEGKFTDLTEADKWAVLEVEAAHRAGIINGNKDGSFGPNAKITREQMAAMLVRAIEYKDRALLAEVKPDGTFKDESKISGYAKEYVAIATSLGIIKGYQNETFAPKAFTTRAQSAVVLYRLLTALKEIE